MSKKYNIRSSQILSPFGIGQIVNFPQELSVMVCGLNLWDEKIEQRKIISGPDSVDERELRFNESRLEKLLGVEYFVKPFEFSEKASKNNHLKLPAVRFPGWHYCTNHKCGVMREIGLTHPNVRIECTACSVPSSNIRHKMIPVRFVAACREGHIQDVPFMEWVHNGPVPADNSSHEISYHTGGGSGDLGSIFIRCTCGQSKSLKGLLNIRKEGELEFDSSLARIGLNDEEGYNFSLGNPNDNNPLGQYCKGYRPWLGLEGINDAHGCGKHLQVLIRGGSNVHFSNVQSAIYLPEYSGATNEYVIQVLEQFGKDKLYKLYQVAEDTLSLVLESVTVVEKGLISLDDLLKGVLKEISDSASQREEPIELKDETSLKYEEYKYITAGRQSENADFKAVVKTFDGYAEQDLLERFFECVVLVEKLKETRVYKGFSRINPVNKIPVRELSLKPVKWLPAVQVYGEGIFLKFRDEVIDTWLENEGRLFVNIAERYKTAMLKRRPQDEPRDLNPFLIVMHTFAHLLIKKLSYDCGYGSSSLRERLYFSADPDTRMNGILIYTSSGDSEGSLGGLVRQGKSKNLGALIKNALIESEWCSADPVCSDIGKSSGQGPDNVNGSACHNCCILPETSCEEFNMLLDRTTIIGSLDNPDIGFFSEYLWKDDKKN